MAARDASGHPAGGSDLYAVIRIAGLQQQFRRGLIWLHDAGRRSSIPHLCACGFRTPDASAEMSVR